MKPTWKYLLYAGVIIVGGGLLFILIGTIKAKNTGFETKTLWDWMDLLIIPLVLALGVFALNSSERTRERETEKKRARAQQQIEANRHYEAALQSYLDRMTELLLKDKLRTARNKEARNVARIRTLSVLRGLDGARKGIVLRFLYEAGLINKDRPIVDLRTAELGWADLSYIDLQDADLTGAYMDHVDLTKTNLAGSVLVSTDLTEAKMNDAILEHVNLSNVKVSDEQLATVRSLKGATM